MKIKIPYEMALKEPVLYPILKEIVIQLETIRRTQEAHETAIKALGQDFKLVRKYHEV